MPSVIAHPFVALALAPLFRRSGITLGLGMLGAACTVVPDLDVIGFHFGIPYDSLLGHRGLTHSLSFAASFAMVLTVAIRSAFPRMRPVAIFLFLFLCTASHGVLDALTDGGLGIAFLSPFSNHRYFFPWQPVVVSPLSIEHFLSGRGVAVLSSEFRWVMAPSLILFAFGWLVVRDRPREEVPCK